MLLFVKIIQDCLVFLFLKGIASEEDTEKAIKLGFEGVIVNNHGSRQLDAGQSAIAPHPILENFKDKIKMMDSRILSRVDVTITS